MIWLCVAALGALVLLSFAASGDHEKRIVELEAELRRGRASEGAHEATRRRVH